MEQAYYSGHQKWKKKLEGKNYDIMTSLILLYTVYAAFKYADINEENTTVLMSGSSW